MILVFLSKCACVSTMFRRMFHIPFIVQQQIYKVKQCTENASSDEGDENRSTISRMSTSSSSYRRSYSFSEEQKIVKWIAKTQRYTEVNGIAMWKLMADSKVLGDRSYQSMKERFRKHIIGKIDMYDLTESEKAAFKSLNARKKFRPVKNGRPWNKAESNKIWEWCIEATNI